MPLVGLPLLYGLPRGVAWSLRGWSKWSLPIYHFSVGMLWLGLIAGGLLLFGFLFPDLATRVATHGAFNVGQWVGIIGTGLGFMSAGSRTARNADFLDGAVRHLTPEFAAEAQPVGQKTSEGVDDRTIGPPILTSP